MVKVQQDDRIHKILSFEKKKEMLFAECHTFERINTGVFTDVFPQATAYDPERYDLESIRVNKITHKLVKVENSTHLCYGIEMANIFEKDT